MWDIDLSDTDLDLLDKDIPGNYFLCLQDVSKTCSRHVFKTSSRYLQRNNFSSSKTSSRRLQDIFARRLQDVLEDEKLLRWRRFEDVFKTQDMSWTRLQEDQQMFAVFFRVQVAKFQPPDTIK